MLHDVAVDRHRSLRARLGRRVGIHLDVDVPALLLEPADVARAGIGLVVVAERRHERSPDLGERHAVLRTLRAGDRGFHRRKVHLHDLREAGLRVPVGPEQPLFLRVPLDQIDQVTATREGEVAKGLVVDREECGSGPVFGTHVRQRRPVGHRQ